jgi:hypothetical protein
MNEKGTLDQTWELEPISLLVLQEQPCATFGYNFGMVIREKLSHGTWNWLCSRIPS